MVKINLDPSKADCHLKRPKNENTFKKLIRMY